MNFIINGEYAQAGEIPNGSKYLTDKNIRGHVRYGTSRTVSEGATIQILFSADGPTELKHVLFDVLLMLVELGKVIGKDPHDTFETATIYPDLTAAERREIPAMIRPMSVKISMPARAHSY